MILNEIQQEGTLHGAPVSPRAANSSASGTEKLSEEAKETVLVLECITLFKSVGTDTSIQDIATTAVVVASAKKMELGTQVFM
jgi:ornithine cyclodeaminase/alanine dehydrogenase-like protein (mu-crystallin family)